MNDSELVQGLRCQDPAAMQWLCNCFLPSLWRFVYCRVHGDQHLAEDITSETILAMLTTIQSQNQAEAEILNPAGWLRTVAGRRISDHFRAASRVQHLLQQSPPRQPDGDAAQHHELEETRAEVRQAMDKLPDQYRVALEWKYLDKLSVQEIAARWDISEKAAESILFRARREFRAHLVQHSPTPPSQNGRRSRTAVTTPDQVPPDQVAPDQATPDASAHDASGPDQSAQQDVAHKAM